jgi:hypothetical protein
VRGFEIRDVIHHQLWSAALPGLRHFVRAAHDDAAGVQALLPRVGRYVPVLHGEAESGKPMPFTMAFSSDED